MVTHRHVRRGVLAVWLQRSSCKMRPVNYDIHVALQCSIKKAFFLCFDLLSFSEPWKRNSFQIFSNMFLCISQWMSTAAHTNIAADVGEKRRWEWGWGWKHWALRPQKPLRLIRDGEVGGTGMLCLTPTHYTVTIRMTLH